MDDMQETSRLRLKECSPEGLVEGFVVEAKLEEFEAKAGAAREMNAHGACARAYAAEIASRQGLSSLLPLLDFHDKWVAYSVAMQLVRLDETKGKALATLARLAEERSGSAAPSYRATTSGVS